MCTSRNSEHRASIKASLHHNGIPPLNHKTLIDPQPPPAGKRQKVSIRVGVQLYGIDAVREAVSTELTKIFDTHSAMHLIIKGDIESNVLFLKSQMIITMKFQDCLQPDSR